MSFLGFGKKKESAPVHIDTERIKSVKVLGSGCQKCHTVFENTKDVLQSAGSPIEVEYITDIQKVVAAGVMSTPALMVNDKIVSAGKVPDRAEIASLLEKV